MQFQAHHSLWYMGSVLGTPACQTTTNNMQSDSCQLRKPRTLPLGLSMSLYVAEDIGTLGTLAVPGKYGENRADGHCEKKFLIV